MTQSDSPPRLDTRLLLEDELGKPISEGIWVYLVDLGRVKEVEQGNKDIHWLAQEIRNAQKAFGSPVQGTKAAPMLDEEYPPASTGLRQRAVSLLLAAEAAKESSVIDFRNKFLNGRVLPHAEVEAWLREQAKRDGPPPLWLKEVPVIQVPESSIGTAMPNLSVDPKWAGPFRVENKFIEYTVPGDDWRRIQVIATGGVLEKLWELIRELTRHYRPWSPSQTTLFVLAGLPPYVRAVQDKVDPNPRLHAATRIVLTVDPAVTPPELAEAYSQARAAVAEMRARALSEKHLRLAIFITEANEKDSWDAKMRQWNKVYPEAEFPGYAYSDRRAFRRDALQVRERLLHPQYKKID